MNSIRIKSTVATVVGTLALAAPAAGAVLEPQLVSQSHNPDRNGAIVLHRDGSEATPFVAEAGAPSTSTSAPAVSTGGFDWGDAAIGAGAALLATALAIGASSALSGRRSSQATKTVSPASQSA
jgi:hypothetical protein